MLAMRHGVELMDTTNLLSKGSHFQNVLDYLEQV